MRTILFVLAAVSSAAFLQSCGGGSAPEFCDEPVPVAVVGAKDFVNMRLLEARVSRTDVELYFDERGEDAARAVPVNEFLLAVAMRAVVAESPRRADRASPGWFIRSAEASCAPPSTTVTQRVSDIDIVSDAALSPDFPAGTSLRSVTTLNLQFDDFHPAAIGQLPVRDYAEVPTGVELPSIEAFLANGPRTAPLHFDLLLDAPVDETREHRFTMTYVLESGDVFTVTSAPVTLTPAN